MSDLRHHGVLGMRWGIRRYQPYGEGGYNPKKKGLFKGRKKAEKPASTYKSPKDMTDDEIRQAIARRKLELEYDSYFKPTVTESKGRAFVKKTGSKFVNVVAEEAATKVGKGLVQMALKKTLGENENTKEIYKKLYEKQK